MADARRFQIWRGDATGGDFDDYTTEVSEGMVVLDAVHQIQAEQRQRPGRALELQGRQVRLVLGRDQRQAAAHVHDAARPTCRSDEPVTIEPMRAFPPIRDLVTDVSWNFRVKKKIKPFKPRPPDAPDGTWRMAQEDVDRVQEFRKCIECFLCQDVCHVLRDHHLHDAVHRPALPGLRRGARDAPARRRGPRRRAARTRTASATATSPSAAPRSAPRTSRSPTTRSSRSRSGWWTSSTIRSRRLFRVFRR